MTKAQRYTMFGLLYFAQGAILSYFTALNALYLLSFDLTMSQVGIFSAIALLNLLALPLIPAIFGRARARAAAVNGGTP